ncbi:E3 ubiquitin-protein ligase RNF115-like [Pollicipes pollicipes]|uniref:E3 ubiquitin-protein ligase RNF115-like n=1 Tax=Pollicipes pollicipes TaxID=41117 RepID=UPI0018856F62|nr:E3 ubiquitin-protein ligase RNF115-like [Pollicipes pollicipes]
MAEASVASSGTRYFCHVCNEDINPVLPEFTCPTCRDGFIEQRCLDTAMADDPGDELPPLDETGLHALAQMLNFGRPLLGVPGVGGSGPGRARTHGYSTRSAHRNAAQHDQQHGLLGEILDTLFATFPNVRVNVDNSAEVPIQFRLHGNPGDYAWGNSELDRIITHLLNQLDTSGPPPLGAELIHRLPRVAVTQQHVDASLQCMVCFEDYTLNETVRQLPCQHLYHSDCIVPWLELHGTCPVCRSSVDPSKADPAQPGPGQAN